MPYARNAAAAEMEMEACSRQLVTWKVLEVSRLLLPSQWLMKRQKDSKPCADSQALLGATALLACTSGVSDAVHHSLPLSVFHGMGSKHCCCPQWQSSVEF